VLFGGAETILFLLFEKQYPSGKLTSSAKEEKEIYTYGRP
jgi:hypothetical protein